MKVIIAVLALLLTAQVAAAGQVKTRLSLKEAIVMALERNSLVKAAGHAAEASRQGIAIAESRYYPGIAFEENFAASNSPTQTFMMKLDEGRFSQNDFLIANLNHPATHSNFRTALTLVQPIFNPSTAPTRELALKESEKGGHELEGTRQEIAFQVFRAYLEVQKAAAQRSSAEEALKEARENLRLATVRNQAGTGLRSDELRARTHLAAMESRLISAGNNLTLARMRLAMLTGVEDSGSVDTDGAAVTFPPPPQEEELVKSALSNRNDLLRLRAELDLGEASLRLARSSWLPTVDGFASYQMNAEDTPFGSDNDAWTAGISLKWQIFDGFRRSRETERASAGRSAAAEQLAHLRKEVSYQVQESLLRREEMEKRRDVARAALQDAEEAVRLLSRRYENSLSTLSELLDAQNALNQARSGLVETDADLSLSGGQIYRAAGVFLKEITK